jgi:23S rRNA (cytidine1920-2'-O)/16S rRNA (cytidine1409-2'-O)-methyltransferase
MSMNSFHARSGRTAPKPGKVEKAVQRPHGMQRADALLVAKALVPSRARARQLIEDGKVRADGETIAKAGHLLAEDAEVVIEEDAQSRFVSRGALKLEGALAASELDVTGMTCLDVGQSTGGFSDCLLQRGAARVIGVEVGHGQLHPRLADDPRCITLEGINARHLTPETLGEHFPVGGFDLIVCDASFISLRLLLPCWPALLTRGGQVLALVKPQFEVGPDKLAKGGVVRDSSLYQWVKDIAHQAAHEAGLSVRGWFESPLIGGGVGNIDGNREFLIWMQKA